MKTAGKVLLGAGGLTAFVAIFWPRKASAKSGCAAPVIGSRWAICSPSGGQMPTVSQGNFDALYDRATRALLAVVDNTTYDDEGNTAIVASRTSAPWAADTLAPLT